MGNALRVSAIAVTIVTGIVFLWTAAETDQHSITMPWWSILGAGLVMVSSGIQRIYRI
ncbi:MAG TPA: hypothetical protein VHB93_01395 [Candidatus Paceibacterota bacterium]|nr:hypothetical protein [Candidatus Paceibacterota bacterium]